MDLPEVLQHTLQHMQFNQPTPIQAEAIPIALSGKDILGSAQQEQVKQRPLVFRWLPT